MKIGYARVSTKDQNLSLQKDALQKEGCELFFEEKASGSKTDRPELRRMIDQLRKGDIVIIWKLDRLGRSLRDLVNLVTEIQDKGAGLKSLNDSIDTTTPQGKLTFHLFAALAEFERDIISERTKAGLDSARARGRKGGRPKGLSQQAKDKAIISETLYREGNLSVSQICQHLGVARSTFYKLLKHRGVQLVQKHESSRILSPSAKQTKGNSDSQSVKRYPSFLEPLSSSMTPKSEKRTDPPRRFIEQ